MLEQETRSSEQQAKIEDLTGLLIRLEAQMAMLFIGAKTKFSHEVALVPASRLMDSATTASRYGAQEH